MKLITAIAALALVAGSMDVEAQKRGKVGLPGDSDDDAPQIAPVAHMAIGAFGVLDPEERKGLAEAAEGGDEEAFEELRAERVEATEAMLGALDDEDARALIKLGMMLGWDAMAGTMPSLADNAPAEINTDGSTGLNARTLIDLKKHHTFNGSSIIELEALDERLDMVQEQLSEEMERMEEGITSKMEAN